MFNDDEPEPQAPTLEATLQALGGEVASTRTTSAGYFLPIFLAVVVIVGAGFTLYLSYTYGVEKSTMDQVYRQQLFKLSLIGGPVLLGVIYWYWRSLRRTVYLCAGGLVEVTPRAMRSIPWHRVTQLETAEVERQFLKGPLGKALATRDLAYVVMYTDAKTGQESAVVIESWAFAGATLFYSTLYAEAQRQMEAAGTNSEPQGSCEK